MAPSFDALAAHGDALALFPERGRLILFSCTSVAGAVPSILDTQAPTRSAHATLSIVGFQEDLMAAVLDTRAAILDALDVAPHRLDLDLCLKRTHGEAAHRWRASATLWGPDTKPMGLMEGLGDRPGDALLAVLQDAQARRRGAA